MRSSQGRDWGLPEQCEGKRRKVGRKRKRTQLVTFIVVPCCRPCDGESNGVRHVPVERIPEAVAGSAKCVGLCVGTWLGAGRHTANTMHAWCGIIAGGAGTAGVHQGVMTHAEHESTVSVP